MRAPDHEVKVLCRTQCTLGEGPLYDEATSTLHFVDISKKQVLHYNVLTSELITDQLDEPVGCLALRRNGQGLACAAQYGFAILEPGRPPTLRYVARPLPDSQSPYTRFNDGACDRRGRFVSGTLHHKTDPKFSGTLYSFDPHTGESIVLDEGDITDSNGLGWSADGKTLYFTNSLTNEIYAYDYDEDTGRASNRRVLIDALAQGLAQGSYCDGLCIDNEGGIWSARWGGGCVTRFRPDGVYDFSIYIPDALNVTACTFGGRENSLLYVTTANCEVSGEPERQAQYPASGDLFVVDLKGRFRGGEWRWKFDG